MTFKLGLQLRVVDRSRPLVEVGSGWGSTCLSTRFRRHSRLTVADVISTYYGHKGHYDQGGRPSVGHTGPTLTPAALSYSEGMAQSSHVEGWTRALSASASQLCRWWARDGRRRGQSPWHEGCQDPLGVMDSTEDPCARVGCLARSEPPKPSRSTTWPCVFPVPPPPTPRRRGTSRCAARS